MTLHWKINQRTFSGGRGMQEKNQKVTQKWKFYKNKKIIQDWIDHVNEINARWFIIKKWFNWEETSKPRIYKKVHRSLAQE